jgi:hypothetical protein
LGYALFFEADAFNPADAQKKIKKSPRYRTIQSAQDRNRKTTPTMKTTDKKSLPNRNRPDEKLDQLRADLKALKHESEELRSLLRCLADAVHIAPRFLRQQANPASMENAEVIFAALLHQVLAKTASR